MKKKTIFTIVMVMVSIFTFAQCPGGQTEVSIDVSTDNWGYEIYWELTPAGNPCGGGATIFSGGNAAVGCNANGAVTSGGYANGITISEGPWCLTDGATYDILSRDGYGDGGASFVVNIATFPLYTFSASAASETFTFTVTPPPAIDGAMQHLHTPAYVFIGAVDIEGEMKNLGSTTINSIDVNYSINGGTTISQNLSGLNIDPFTAYHYTHPTVWIPVATGAYILDLWISNINGQGADAVPSNDNLTTTINVKDPIPNIIPSYTSATNTFTYDIIVNATNQVNTPRDLDFHPNGDLWVINTGLEDSGPSPGGSTVKVTNPGVTSQNSLWQQDGNAWHFMSLPSAIAFSDNGNFATTTSAYDCNHNGGAPFSGPTLWSSDPNIYAQYAGPGTNGSHLDMLHESSYCMGIASESDNVFWVFDANNNDIVRYDFAEDHGPGNDDHDDGIVRRYPQPVVNWINADISSHLVIDRNTEWLYIVDGGNQRILRLDINSGTIGGTPNYPQYDPVLAEYTNVTGVTWEVVVSTGLVQPAGIDIIEDRLVVTDYSNGDIIFYDVSSIPAVEIGRLQTNEPGIMGIVIGPEGKIWYVNHTLNKVVRIEPSTIILTATWNCISPGNCQDPGTGNGQYTSLSACQTACVATATAEEISDLLIYPNPAKNTLTITGNYISVTIYDIFGKEVMQIPDLIKNTVDISCLSSGLYFMNVDDGKQIITKKLIIQ